MPTPIFERLNGVRIEAEPKRTAGSRPTDRSKEQGQGAGAAQLNRTDFVALKSRIQRRIIAELAPEADLGGVPGRRAIEELLPSIEGERYEQLIAELQLLAKRISIILWSIGLAVLCAFLVCLLIGTAFLGAFLFLDLSRTVAMLFIFAVGALTVCVLLFLREVLLAAMSVHHSVWPQPARPEQK